MQKNHRIFYSTLVLSLSLVLFYLPTILFQVENSGGLWDWDFLGVLKATLYSSTFLLNYFWLVPMLMKRRNSFPIYFLVNVGMVLVTMFAIPFWIESQHCPIHSPGRITAGMSLGQIIIHHAGFSLRDGIMVILAAALGYAIRVGREKEDIHNRELQLKAEERKTELQSLKAQLNPHFLFNSLNNIYALIGFAPERAQEALHTLSKMLRFMIYDSSESVPLEKEAAFIGEYVELMRLRMGEEYEVGYRHPDNLPTDLRIAPLLYITLVENAFKHSGRYEGKYYVRLSLREESGRIVFRVENTCAAGKKEQLEKAGVGVGIANVRSQLNLLYPDRHEFEISAGIGVYAATLSIEIEALRDDREKTADVAPREREDKMK